MTSTPSLRKTSSKARLNLASRSRSRNLAGSSPSCSFQTRFRACCTAQAPVGGAASHMDTATADLDEEQHVQPGQQDGVDHEEVGGQDLIGVLADELAPSALAAPAPAAG